VCGYVRLLAQQCQDFSLLWLTGRYIKANVGEMDLPSGFDRYPDFLAMGLLLLGTLFISLGVRVTSRCVVALNYKNTSCR